MKRQIKRTAIVTGSLLAADEGSATLIENNRVIASLIVDQEGPSILTPSFPEL
jgi:hypothetical protein